MLVLLWCSFGVDHSILGSTQMGGGHGACPHQLCASEQQKKGDIQDFPHPAAVSRGAQNNLSPRCRGPGRESAEVRGKISEVFLIRALGL